MRKAASLLLILDARAPLSNHELTYVHALLPQPLVEAQ